MRLHEGAEEVDGDEYIDGDGLVVSG